MLPRENIFLREGLYTVFLEDNAKSHTACVTTAWLLPNF